MKTYKGEATKLKPNQIFVFGSNTEGRHGRGGEGKIDMCVFLIDDLSANPHEADIQMLLRQCRIHNIPVACNRHTADLMITSDLWGTNYEATEPTYQKFDRK